MFSLLKITATTTALPYTSAPTTPSTKLESIKNWTISTYKCSRQTIFEKLGKSSRTVDSEMETQIESLRETQRKTSEPLMRKCGVVQIWANIVE